MRKKDGIQIILTINPNNKILPKTGRDWSELGYGIAREENRD